MTETKQGVRVRLWKPPERSPWRALVEACRGTALHLPETHAADFEPNDMQCLVFQADESPIACALGIVQRRRLLKTIALGAGNLLLPTSPAVSRPEWNRAVLDALIRHAREAGFARLQVQPQSSTGLETHPLLAERCQTTLVEFELDLRRPVEEILARMHKTHRKNARRAEARGVQVHEDTSLDGLMRLRAMQEVSAQRAAERQHGFRVRDESYFRDVYETVYSTGVGRVFFARRDQKELAALAFLSTANRAVTVRSGSSPEGYETYAMYLLHVALIQDLQPRGVELLNLGGVPVEAAEAGHPQAGLYEFKHGFGSRPVPRASVDIALREET